MGALHNFINGFKKSFDGKTRTRKLNKCESCHKASFFYKCLFCSTEQDYVKLNKDDNNV